VKDHAAAERVDMPAKNPKRFVAIPFIRERTHHITVVARLAGRPARFIVDTGAGGTILDSKAAVARYKLTLSAASRRAGGVGSAAMRMSYVGKHDLTLHGLDLSGTRLLTLDLSHVNAGLKKARIEPVVGVIGADVLWRRHAIIDYDRGVLLLSG